MARHLLPLALEIDTAEPLIEAALSFMRAQRIIAPGITTTEALVWRVQRIARTRVRRRITAVLSQDKLKVLDELLTTEGEDTGLTRLAWLRQPAGKPSANSLYHLLERLIFLHDLQLPALPPTLHPNRVRRLAQRCQSYPVQALASLANPVDRYAHLVAYLHEQQAEVIDQLLDMADRWLNDLMRRGRNAQKHHLYQHVTELNRALNTLTRAVVAFLQAREKAIDPFEAVFAEVDEAVLTATLASEFVN